MVYSQTAALKGGSGADAEPVKKICGVCHDLADDPVVSYHSLIIAYFNLLFFSNVCFFRILISFCIGLH